MGKKLRWGEESCTSHLHENPFKKRKSRKKKELESENDILLTFWTVVVRSKQSWIILFFVTEKSVIPVNGALEGNNNPLKRRRENPLRSHCMLVSIANPMGYSKFFSVLFRFALFCFV